AFHGLLVCYICTFLFLFCLFFFFFFQAEDGIRDFHVTGVQTCALPICKKMNDISPSDPPNSPSTGIVLWWLPVGAGAPTRISQITSQWWERLQAWREKRDPQRLVHAALEVFSGGERFVIEMGPEWSDPHIEHKGVVVCGPVGLRALGRSGLFRYEIRCWANGELSDRSWAIGGPVTVSTDEVAARTLLQRID